MERVRKTRSGGLAAAADGRVQGAEPQTLCRLGQEQNCAQWGGAAAAGAAHGGRSRRIYCVALSSPVVDFGGRLQTQP